ncbi:MAG TPA: uracil-DNA glycosylase [Paracoccaceae bacterium]
MGIAEDIAGDAGWHVALAALAWQHDLGATEAVGDTPVNRYEAVSRHEPADAVPRAAATATPGVMPQGGRAPEPVAAAAGPDPAEVARQAAARAGTLEELRAALEAFELCELKRGAKTTVFADGQPGAPVMVIGEAPGREEDIAGRPFVGRAGQLLDRMFAAIGMARQDPDPARAIYITNVMPWRPPQNRDPSPEEIAMMQPFLARHVELAAPDLIVIMGNTSCQAVLGRKGITRMRGEWASAFGRPVLPMFHPAYLLRNPAAKRETWADLLELQARLRRGP